MAKRKAYPALNGGACAHRRVNRKKAAGIAAIAALALTLCGVELIGTNHA
jgi:hypothetical protein